MCCKMVELSKKATLSYTQHNKRRRINEKHKMGTKTPSPNPHTHHPPNHHTIPPLPIFDLHTNPLLPQLGLPTNPLPPIHHHFSSPATKMGFLSLPQKGLKIWAPRNILEIQMPIPTAPSTDTCQGGGRSTMG